MSYSDVLGATKLYGDLLNTNFANAANNLDNIKAKYTPGNPYSSGAYTPRSARNIYTGQGRELYDPTKESNRTKENITQKGLRALQYAQIGKTISPYLTKAPFAPIDLGPAALVYGATRDSDPYSYSPLETAGTVASTYMAAGQAAPLLGKSSFTKAAGPLGIAFGLYLAMKGKAKAKALKAKQKREMNEQRQEIYANRRDAVEEGREQMQTDLMNRLSLQRQSQYDNMYGGNYNPINMAQDGMKMDKNIVAEFTGNELIVNDQDALENDIAKGNNKSAANRIRMAMKGGKVTPGPETHKNNPMPVDSEGNIYAGGGALPFKAMKGAGVYDHATDQFKMDMSDDNIVKVVKKNIKKWKKNNMA